MAIRSRAGLNQPVLHFQYSIGILNVQMQCGYNGLPISQLRKIHYKGAIIEMLWILGIHMNDERYAALPMTNTKYLNDYGVKYWNPWADENGNLGPVYGSQLSAWKRSRQCINSSD